MSHYTVLVRFEHDGPLETAQETLEEVLAPYDENMEVDAYKEYHKGEQLERMAEHYDLKPDDLDGFVEHMRDWNGNEGGVDEDGLFEWSTYNPESKWDWWLLGGRWSGDLILKDGAQGIEGRPGTGDNPTGIDMAFLKDLDLDAMDAVDGGTSWDGKLYPGGFWMFAALDENGWHARGEMGWFGMAYDEKESQKEWASKFRERFLSNQTDKTVIAVVDCHI